MSDMYGFLKKVLGVKCISTSPLPEEKMREIVEWVDARLTSREVKIIKAYYGLGDEKGKTDVQIGREYDVTGERIRQIRDKAIRKLVREHKRRVLRWRWRIRRPLTMERLEQLLGGESDRKKGWCE